MIDGDDTYPVEHAQELVNLIEKGYDMVIGDRLSSTYFKENKRPFHNSGNRLVRFLINKLFKSNIEDIMTGYRALSRHFVKNFPVISQGFEIEIETEMTIHALDNNFVIKVVPINYRDRQEGSYSKLNTFSDGFKVLTTIFRMFRDYKPFIFFTTLSVIIGFISVGISIPIIIEFMETHLVPRFPTLIVAGVLGVISILLWVCGIILEVLVKKNKQIFEILMNK